MGVLAVGRKTWCGDNVRGDPGFIIGVFLLYFVL